MKLFTFFLCSICFVGCSSTQQTTDTVVPRLLDEYPLPVIPQSIMRPYIELNMDIFVNKDSSISQVRLLNSSGSKEWDSLAIASIRKWRYLPGCVNNNPTSMWMRQKVTIQISDPKYISLAEILCTSLGEADSVYKVLEHGYNFGELARRYSNGSSRLNDGILGRVNIYQYSEKVRLILEHLAIDEFTKPFRYGDQYVILKRIKDD